MEATATKITRIPRPQGFNSIQDPLQKYEVGARSILKTGKEFGIRGTYTTASFAALGIPTHVWRRAVMEGLAEGLEEKKLLTGGLYHLSLGTDEIDQLSGHLLSRIIGDPTAHPILVKELNSLISNRTRLAEAFTKLGQAMKEQGEEVPQEALTHADIIEILVNEKHKITNQKRQLPEGDEQGILLSDISKDVEGTPELDPIPMSLKERPGGEKEKPKVLPDIADVVITPK